MTRHSTLRTPMKMKLKRRSGLPRRIRASFARRSAFTIIELLMVVTIIIVLLSILIVAMSAATRSGQRARTQFLMTSIKTAMVRFKEDIGYYPPVLGDPDLGINGIAKCRNVWYPPNPDLPGYDANVINWYSYTSAADYLIGYGTHRQDGYGFVPNAAASHDWETENSLGIRHPGPDGNWGHNLILNRMGNSTGLPNGWPADNLPQPKAADQGKIYGPYLDLPDERLLAGITGFEDPDNVGDFRPELVFPGDPIASGASFESLPKVIVDYWGNPIRYYRRLYPPGALHQSYRAGVKRASGADFVPTLSDIIFLRPWTIKPGTEVEARLGDYTDPPDRSTTFELESGEFAVFSAGPDRRVIKTVRVDPDNEYNRDNITEVGP